MSAPFHLAINFDKGEIPIKKYGAIANIKCDMICVSPIGSYKEPAREHVEDQIKYLFDFTAEVGFPQTKCVKYEELAKTGGALSLYLAPSIDAKSDKMRSFGKYCMWLLCMDDIMDEKTMEHPLTTTYEALSKDLKVFVGILNGDHTAKHAPPQVSTMSHYKALCGVVQAIHDAFMKNVPGFKCAENRKHLIKKTNDFLHGFLWRFDRPDGTHTSESTYLYFRRHHSASYCIFEVIALLNDIDWAAAKVDRDNVEFLNWLNSYANSLSMSNDILSLRKELTDSETENLVIHRYENQDTDINDAVKGCLNFTNSETHEMGEYGKRLLKQNPNSKHLEKLVEISGWSLDGHLFWYGFSQRYGKMKLKERHLTTDQYNNIVLTGTRKPKGLHQVY